MPLFKRAVVFGDIHFGRSGNSPVAIRDNLDFIHWMIERARVLKAETCIFLGDWHDNRHAIQIATMNASLDGMEALNNAFERTWWLPGNHDLYYRDRRDVSSIEFARNLTNIQIVREPTREGNCLLLPWLVGDETKTVKTLKGDRYVFAHLEVPGFLMNARVEMPKADGAIDIDGRLKGAEAIFSGHFHPRQRKGRMVYIGNVMPFNFSDAWDDDRGFMLLDWESGEQTFETWPNQPVFRTAKLSEIIEKPHEILKERAAVRALADLDLPIEEMQEIRDTLLTEFSLRRFEFVQQGATAADEEQVELAPFRSVDQIVVEGLRQVDSTGVDPERLVALYEDVARETAS